MFVWSSGWRGLAGGDFFFYRNLVQFTAIFLGGVGASKSEVFCNYLKLSWKSTTYVDSALQIEQKATKETKGQLFRPNLCFLMLNYLKLTWKSTTYASLTGSAR
jgi:hypothetical protein